MSRILYTLVLFLLLFAMGLPLSLAGESQGLISFSLFKSYTQEELEQTWEEKGIPTFMIPVSYAVDIYEVTYFTSWQPGEYLRATGLYFVPRTEDAMPLLCYHHGSRSTKGRRFSLSGEEAICMAFATDGYAVLQPDYLGLGEGEDRHLYMHAPSEAMASIDMIRATEAINDSLGIILNDQLYLTGYSQGGHATMATHRMLQEQFADTYDVTASSPMSGAYDLTGVQEEVMFKPYSHPAYLPYLLLSYQHAYDFYDDIRAVFRPPYDSILPAMFNGEHSLRDINKIMPPVPKDVIREEVIREYIESPDDPFRLALKENSIYDWAPEDPMMLCYCEGDQQVTYMNSVIAYEAMKEKGSESVRLKSAGKKFGHKTCAVYASLYTKMWFDSFRKGSEKGRKGPVFKRMLISLSKLKTPAGD